MIRLRAGQSRLSRSFAALEQPRFRVFWLGQLVSLIGTWMQNIGLSWLVIQLTGSPFLLGVVTAAQFLPVMVFSVFAGPFVDRFPKRGMLLITQSSLMVLAAVLALITSLGVAQYWMILVFSVLLGLINTLDVPTRQAFVIELSGREHLVNAISLNSAAFNAARIVGPAVAGVLIGVIGIAPCFMLNSLSFLAVLLALLTIPASPRPSLPKERVTFAGIAQGVTEGLVYVKGHSRLLLLLILMGVLSTFVINYNVFVPEFAQQRLEGGALHFGLLMTAMGVGSLAAALRLAVQSKKGPQIRAIALGAIGMSAFLLLTGVQNNFWISALLMVATGYFTITFSATANSWVQTNTDDTMRGRVMSLYALMFGGMTPIGSLYAGKAIDVLGAAGAMVLSGSLGLVATLAIGFAATKKAGHSLLRKH